MDKKEFLIRKGYGDQVEGMSPIEIEELFNSVTGDFTAANTYREPGNRGGRIGLYAGTPEEGIGSLDAGAPDITYEGNEGPQAPMKMAQLEEAYDKYVNEMIEMGQENSIMSFQQFMEQAIAEGQMSGGQPLPEDPTKPVNPFQPKPKGIQMAAQGGRIGFSNGSSPYEEYKQDLEDGIISPDTTFNEWLDNNAPDPDYDKSYASGGRAGYNSGGRTGFQTGGVTETRQLPQEWVEALGKTYAADLTKQAGIPSITTATAQQPGETAGQWQQRQAQAQQFGITKAGMADLAPQVAAQDPYQAAAYAQATDPTKGLGGYQPYLQAAGTAAGAATALTGTGAGTGAGSIQSYMSPYQQQVIDTTMADYDAQAAKSRTGLGAQAVAGGAFGSGRHGIAEAEFDALSNRGRASQLANLRSTGFQQASQRRQQDLSNQMGISNLQQGLGGTQQDFARSQIAGLGTLGAGQQAQNQAVLDAQRQFATMAVQEPVNRMNMLGSGVMGVMGGMSPYSTRIGEAPATAQSSPLATALGVGLAGADIYSRLLPKTS